MIQGSGVLYFLKNFLHEFEKTDGLSLSYFIMMNPNLHLLKSDRMQGELVPALKYIFLFSVFFWLPFIYFGLRVENPINWFSDGTGIGAALMFVSGAIIANATAVGGGMIFNPTLQMAFAVSGYSALVLSIVVQTSGMSSGTYGWFKKGEFHYVHRTHLLTMLTTTVFSTSVWTGLLIRYMFAYPHVISLCMKLSSIGVAFYVFQVIWASIREREQHGENLGGKSYRLEVAEAIAQGSKLDEIKKPQRHKEKVFIDWRIYGWIFLGTLLNVTTAVGIGELVCSHLIKYYRSATKTSIAVGTLMQAVSVITQTIFILIFLRDLLILDLACIGILFCAIGGRLAPSILTYRHIEPYVKYFLAFAALSMGGVSSFMVLATVIG